MHWNLAHIRNGCMGVVLFCMPILVFAQTDTPINVGTSTVSQGLSCFDYYKFQSITIDLHAEKQVYKAGEGAKFIGSFTNKNTYPVVGGSLILRISKFDPRSQVGNDIIDEWTVQKDINLLAGETQQVNYQYQLPSGLPTGTYTLTSYFLTSNKFELAGLAFTDDIYGGYASFNVKGNSEKSTHFERTNVKVDDQPYAIFGLESKIFPENKKSVSVNVPLKNDTSENVKTKITYSLFYWDGSDPGNFIKEWTEYRDVSKNSSKVLSFDINLAERPVYYLKIKAEAGDQKSEIHIRFVKVGFHPRLNDLGITSYPLTEGKENILYACYHNTAPLSMQETLFVPGPPGSLRQSRNGKLELSLKDLKGNILGTYSYDGAISGDMDVFTVKYAPKKNLDKFVLSAKLYDDKGKLTDSADVTYDCSKFSKSFCAHTESEAGNDNTLLYIGIVAVLIAVVASFYFQKRNISNGKSLN